MGFTESAAVVIYSLGINSRSGELPLLFKTTGYEAFLLGFLRRKKQNCCIQFRHKELFKLRFLLSN